ncbi:MAG TPA: terminase family protein [Allosphingosinicella sp.]|jgi:phage terminase large subunit-like protein
MDEEAARRARAALLPLLDRLDEAMLEKLAVDWGLKAHKGQREPKEDWRLWLMLAGRGFGKTRAGAEWVSDLARYDASLRIALVGATMDEVVSVMIRGESGLMAVAREDEDVLWFPSSRRVVFASGAQAHVYAATAPAKLRGPQHHYAWCDELAKWPRAQETWDNLMLGLRLGEWPQVMVTTTPRPVPLLKRIKDEGERTGGATGDNPHLPRAFVVDVEARYGATRLGRQELNGELIEEVEGALWTRDLVERCRCAPLAHSGGVGGGAAPIGGTGPHPPTRCAGGPLPLPQAGEGNMVRIVIGVDPPVSAAGDACGIVAVGLGADGVGYVLADHSVSGLSPDGWARAVAAAAEAHGADRVVAEANQGGEMVASVLRAADFALPVRLVHARRGKAARAEPVAALFESGRARFAGAFPQLEDELCALSIGGGYAGPTRSPDRADAMVWAFTELMLGKRKVPAVRGL